MAPSFLRFLFSALLLSIIIITASHAQSPEEEFNKAAQFFEEGTKQYNASNFSGAIENWEAALSIYLKYGSGQGIGAALGNIGLAHRSLGDFKKAIEYHEKASAIARELGDKQSEGVELGNVGLAYKDLGDYPRAIEYYQKALAITEEIGDKQNRGFWYGSIGSANLILGNSSRAIEYFEKAIAVVSELGDRQSMGFWLSRLGLASRVSGDYRKAIECHERAATIAREFKDRQGEKDEYSSLSRAYEGLGDNHRVIEYEEKALSLADELGDTEGAKAALVNLSRSYERLGNNQKVIEYNEKALTLAEKHSDRQYMVRRLFDLGNAYFIVGNYRKAMEYYERALAVVDELGDRKNRGVILVGLGNAFVRLGDYQKAIGHFEQALTITEETGDKKSKGVLLGNLGVVYGYLGQYRKAMDYHEQALSIAEELGDKQSKGHQLGNLGNCHFVLGDNQKAIEYYEKALAIAQELGDKMSQGSWLGNIGNCYERLGDYRKAGDYFLKALAIAEEIGDKHNKGSWLGNLGGALEATGHYPKAIEYYEKALAVAEEIGDKQGKGSWLGNLGLTYSRLGDYRKAIDYYERALLIADEIGDRKNKGLWLGNLGNAYEELGDYHKAIGYYEKALAIAEEVGDKHGKGIHIGNLGLIYSKLGNHGKSIEYYEKAMAIMEETGDKTSGAILHVRLGSAFLALDRDEEAFAIFTKQDHPIKLGEYYLKKGNYQEAKKQFDRDREKYEEARDADLIVASWIGMGLSCEGMRDYANGYAWYTKAIELLEDQRSGLAPSERERFFEGKIFGLARIEAYEGAVRCAFMMNRLEEAFFWAENTRARIFSEMISGRHSGQNFKIPSELAKEEEVLANRIMINKKEQQTAFQKYNIELLRRLEKEYPALKHEMDAFVERLRREYPQYAAIRYPQPVRLGQIALREGETIIEYQVTEPYTIGLVIRDGKVVRGFKVDKTRRELENLVAGFRSPFQDGRSGGEFSPGVASELAELLLKPALSEVPKDDHLIIIPDKCLSLLPFESLLVSVPEEVLKEEERSRARMRETEGAGVVYAIDRFPISYYQSASVLSLTRGLRIKRAGEATFFGVGDPIFDDKDERSGSLRSIVIAEKTGVSPSDIVGNVVTKEAGYEFPRLVNTAKEVLEVSRLFQNSKVLLGLDASKHKVKAEDLSAWRYVLFSTHGVLGNEIPYIKQPALVLSLVGNENGNGFLTASEIFGMNLNASLVGLSACKTGLGVQTAGEGVVGLSRAFMYAGVDSVLVSLWSVADESTYKLMVKFFEGIKAGKDKITALKEAKEYLRTSGYENPFFWAPFILIGEN